MEEFFLKILNMSIAACWIILAVIAARFLLKKAPKWIVVAMWGIAGLRLVCPFSIESVLSLIPSAETVPQEILYTDEPAVHTGMPFVNEVVNPVIYDTLAPSVDNTVKPAQSAASVAAVVWVVGVGLMLAYMATSFIRVYMRVREAAFQKDNIWVGDGIDTPFVLGVFRPRIYLPSAMSEEDMGYVVAHEKAHLKRRDNWWKPAGFLILAVHWFNPLVWLAYILLCRDIEFACDEKVIKALSVADRKAYSNALINCSAPRRVISACPLAFGENGVKSRIKSVLNYKKPAFWIILIAVIACIVVAVCFLTNPKTKPGNDGDNSTGVVANEPQEFTQAFDKLSITLTTDKTEYVLGEDKVAEVTATVKNTSGEKVWLVCGGIGKNVMLPTSLELPESEISLIDLDGSFGVDDAIDEKMLEPGEEYVQKMRFDLLREAHPFTKEPIPPAEPGEYKGTCGAFFVTDENRIVSSEWEKCSLDFNITLKESRSIVSANDPQEFTQAFDKLSITLTTDKTAYFLGEDKIAEVTATVKNTSGEKLWLNCDSTGGKNFLLRTTLELPGSGISLQDLDYLPAVNDAIEKKLLDPGEEYVQKMRFDLTGKGYHPLTNQLLPPVEPGVYQGKCAGTFDTGQYNETEVFSLDFKIAVKQSPSIVLTNDPQKFSKTFENLAMTVTTDKTAYFIGEDKIAEVTATVKNISGKTLWLHCGNTGKNIMVPTSLRLPNSEINLIDLDRSYVVDTAEDEVKLEPGEEYVQKMRFDFVREGLHPGTGEPLVPAKPGVYQGDCAAIYAFDQYTTEVSDEKSYYLNFQILLKERNTGEFVNSAQKFTQDFDKFSVTVTSDKAKYVIGEDKIAQVTAVVKNTSDKSIFLYCGDLGRNHMIHTELKHWISEMNLIDLDCAEIVADAVNEIELKPGEEFTQVMRFDLARDQFVSSLTGEKLSLSPAEAGWYLGTCRVCYHENRDDDFLKTEVIGFRIALVNDINDDPGDINDAPAYDQKNDNTISENDVKTVIDSYPEDRPVHDAQLIDLDFDGDEELLVLVSWANPNVFEVWEKNSGKMGLTCRFGAGKLNWIDKISLEKGVIDGERVYLFSFSMSGENIMTADEVLSVVKKTADGYEVEHLLSRGRIDYTGIPEPFTKEFYRKGWSKYDIGMDDKNAYITKEEYIELYKEYTGITLDL